jgi:hypothetical protein
VLKLKTDFLLGAAVGLTLVAVACGQRPGAQGQRSSVHPSVDKVSGSDSSVQYSKSLNKYPDASDVSTIQPVGEPFTGEWILTTVHCQGPEQIDVNALLSKVPDKPAYSNFALTRLTAKEDGSVEMSRMIAACIARIPLNLAVSEDQVTFTGGDMTYNYPRCSTSMYLANHKYRPHMNIGTTAFGDMFSNKKNDFQFHVARDGKLYLIQTGRGFCADGAVLILERSQY